MINLKKDKKILGCFFNGERIVDILNHKGESMLDFSETLKYSFNLPIYTSEGYNNEKEQIRIDYEKIGIHFYSSLNNNFDLKSKYPLDLEYMIEQDNLGVFERTSPKFNFKLYLLLFQRYFLNESLAEVLNKERNNGWELTKEKIKTLFKINFDFDFEKAKALITSFTKRIFYPIKTIIFLKNVHTQIMENIKIKELIYDAFKNPDFYIEKFESVKEDAEERIGFNILNYKTINPIYYKNTDEDVFVIQSELEGYSYNNIRIHIANKTSYEIILEICFINDAYYARNIETKIEFSLPANSNDYVLDIQDSYSKDLYFIRRKDGKLLNNKYHTNGWVKLF